jgi:hypothetical protein
LWAKGLNARDIRKEMFPVYVVKCLSLKEVHNWVEKHGKRFANDEEVETEMWKWLRQQSKDFYAAGYEALGQVYQCWWSICWRNKFFFRFEYRMFYILIPFMTNLLALVVNLSLFV